MRSQDFNRSQRVADQLGRALAQLLQTEVADPRVRGVTVSGVDLSPDLRNATVYVTCPLGGDSASALAALGNASSFLRHRLGESVRMKYLPRLTFEADHTLDEVDRIEALLKKAGHADRD